MCEFAGARLESTLGAAFMAQPVRQDAQCHISLPRREGRGHYNSLCESDRRTSAPQPNHKGISMSKDHKRTDTKNKPKLTAKEKKAKKTEKAAKKADKAGLGIPHS